MRQILIDIKSNRITSFWSDESITWLPLDTYEYEDDEDYLVLVQSGAAGYNKPRIIKGSFLKALLKRIFNNNRRELEII